MSDRDQHSDNEGEGVFEESQHSGRRKTSSFAGRRGSIDFGDCESTILRCKEENDAITNSLSGLSNTTKIHTRRIKDLFSQFEDARVRLDKLLRRTTTPRREIDMSTPRRESSTFEMASPRTSRRDVNSPRLIRMSSSARDYDSDAVSTRSSDTEGGDGSRRGSCLSLMTTNVSHNFEMVSLTVKLDESGEED